MSDEKLSSCPPSLPMARTNGGRSDAPAPRRASAKSQATPTSTSASSESCRSVTSVVATPSKSRAAMPSSSRCLRRRSWQINSASDVSASHVSVVSSPAPASNPSRCSRSASISGQRSIRPWMYSLTHSIDATRGDHAWPPRSAYSAGSLDCSIDSVCATRGASASGKRPRPSSFVTLCYLLPDSHPV